MTVEEFRLLPYPTKGSRYELRAGKLASIPVPKNRYIYLQIRIRKLLEREAGERAVASTKWPFRATPEHEFRYADVALVNRLRYVRVVTGDTTRRYREGDQIPLTLFPSHTIVVSEIFSILSSSSQG